MLIFSTLLLSSCATVLGGQKTDHQAHKPQSGEPKRQLRIGFIIADLVLCPPCLIVDFVTKKIYKPEARASKIKK